MKGLLGTFLSFSLAITRPERKSRAASAPPMKVLLCVLVGSCPLPGVLWLAKAWWVMIESVLSFRISNFVSVSRCIFIWDLLVRRDKRACCLRMKVPHGEEPATHTG